MMRIISVPLCCMSPGTPLCIWKHLHLPAVHFGLSGIICDGFGKNCVWQQLCIVDGQLCIWHHCVGTIALAPLCWHHMLAPLCWHHYVGTIVLAPLCWHHCVTAAGHVTQPCKQRGTIAQCYYSSGTAQLCNTCIGTWIFKPKPSRMSFTNIAESGSQFIIIRVMHHSTGIN